MGRGPEGSIEQSSCLEADVRVPYTGSAAKEEEHKPRLIGGHEVRPPPGPTKEDDPSSGTAHCWMRYNGTPFRVCGERAKEISKALTQLLRHTAPRQGISVAEDGYVELGGPTTLEAVDHSS